MSIFCQIAFSIPIENAVENQPCMTVSHSLRSEKKNLTAELSTVLNRKTFVLHLAWTDEDDRRKELVASADAVIAAWKEKEMLFEDGSETKKHFEKIEKLWRDYVSGAIVPNKTLRRLRGKQLEELKYR